ncbi:MAG: flagellin [Polyangiales bacterium]
MALTVMTNTSSLNAQRHLGRTQHNLSMSMGRLSSGLKINRAGDNAAGLAISENLRADLRSLKQAQQNANDGISLLQTAEGAMNEISGILGRMRELAMIAATDTVGNTERAYSQLENAALIAEITRITDVTEFNGTTLIDGSASALDFQVGMQNTANDRLTVAIADVDATALGVNALDISTKAGAQGALATVDAAIQTMSGARATIGSAENRLQVTIGNLSSTHENLSAAHSGIRDTDMAEETASMTRSNILMQAGVSVLAQANQLPSMALSLLG